jgi:TPR repeat protein
MESQPWKAASTDSEFVRIIKYSADRGNPDAQFELGLLYSTGSRGLPKDWPEARLLFMRAARRGHIGARRFLVCDAPSQPIARWLFTRGWYPSSL